MEKVLLQRVAYVSFEDACTLETLFDPVLDVSFCVDIAPDGSVLTTGQTSCLPNGEVVVLVGEHWQRRPMQTKANGVLLTRLRRFRTQRPPHVTVESQTVFYDATCDLVRAYVRLFDRSGLATRLLLAARSFTSRHVAPDGRTTHALCMLDANAAGQACLSRIMSLEHHVAHAVCVARATVATSAAVLVANDRAARMREPVVPFGTVRLRDSHAVVVMTLSRDGAVGLHAEDES